MKITKIDLLYCDPVEGGWRPSLCRIYTDEGIYGDGEVALSYGGASQAAFAMLKDMANRLIGMNPLDHEVIWQKLYQGCFWSYNGGPIVFGGISAFDIALWDIKGKVYGQPLYRLLGGKTQRYPESLCKPAAKWLGYWKKNSKNTSRLRASGRNCSRKGI